jgi:ATPase subunit of ABC transporter with duplicated ATPase domains
LIPASQAASHQNVLSQFSLRDRSSIQPAPKFTPGPGQVKAFVEEQQKQQTTQTQKKEEKKAATNKGAEVVAKKAALVGQKREASTRKVAAKEIVEPKVQAKKKLAEPLP